MEYYLILTLPLFNYCNYIGTICLTPAVGHDSSFQRRGSVLAAALRG